MPTVEGLQFGYALHQIPPGRLPSGAGAGSSGTAPRWWRQAGGSPIRRPGRALRHSAAEFGHRLFGLPAPPREQQTAAGDLLPGRSERLAIGPITCQLVPRALLADA